MIIRTNGRLLLLMLSCLLCSCAVGPDYQKPSTDIGEWFGDKQLADASDAEVPSAWWEGFNDPMLNELVADTAANNKDIAIALANIERARALRSVASGEFFPSVVAGATARRDRISTVGGPEQGFGGGAVRERFIASLDAVWELDLFGRIRRSVEAANAEAQAAIEDQRAILVSAIAETASNYFQLRGLQKQIDLANRNIALLGEVEAIARSRYEAGITSQLDLVRASAERETITASLPLLEAEMMAAIYRISVLTGKTPEFYADRLEEFAPLPLPPDRVPLGLRSTLLQRRPDIRRAERQLAAATARIGVAKAQLFPDFSLTGSLGKRSERFSDLFVGDARTFSLGGLLNWPIFQGSALLANIDATEAETTAAMASYEQTVLVALEETEAALTRYGKEWQALRRLQAAEANSQEAQRIARLRYEGGEESFLVILDAERANIVIQNDLIESETRILTHLTQLYKALGGGWEELTHNLKD